MKRATLTTFTSLALALSTTSMGCKSKDAASQTGWQAGATGDKSASSGTDAERWFPLVDGNIYHYRTEVLGDAPSPPGMLMLKVHRSSNTAGELRKPVGTQQFSYDGTGIRTQTKTGSPAWVLKLPLSPTATWLGPQGGVTKIEKTDVAITTDAGSYTGCVTTLEERRGDTNISVRTTICPEVGIVTLEASSGGSVERASLVYYGAPVEVGPEGTRRVE